MLPVAMMVHVYMVTDVGVIDSDLLFVIDCYCRRRYQLVTAPHEFSVDDFEESEGFLDAVCTHVCRLVYRWYGQCQNTAALCTYSSPRCCSYGVCLYVPCGTHCIAIATRHDAD